MPNAYQGLCKNIQAIHARAKLYEKIRLFFAERQVLEVETPLLSQSTSTSTYLTSMETQVFHSGKQHIYYLQTSPEYAMKRLLASGVGDIYQICKAFRQGESGNRHNPEFTLLEWYRVGYSYADLMAEVDEFLQNVAKTKPACKASYRQIFQQYVAFDPLQISIEELQSYIVKFNLFENIMNINDKDFMLDIIMSTQIEPHLGKNNIPDIIYDYPTSQAMLATIKQGEFPVAQRFEVYLQGKELANGFQELCCPHEQRQRFIKENDLRKEKKLPSIPLDENFLSALESGLPQCSGVALGIDRLLMYLTGLPTINEILAFSIEQA